MSLSASHCPRFQRVLLSIFLSVFVVMGNTSLIRLPFFIQSPNFHLQREVDLEVVIREDDTAEK